MKNKKNITYLCGLFTIFIIGIVFLTVNNKENFLEKLLANNDINNIILTNKNIILNVTMENSYKTGNINELYDDSAIVLIADFVNDEKTEIKYNGVPNTFSKFNIKKVLKNDSGVKLSNQIQIRRRGGIVTLKQLLNSRGEEYIKKMGVDNLSKEQIETGLVEFKNNNNLGDKDLNEWKTRLLLLNYNKDDNTFILMQDDYGMLSYDENNNTAYDFNSGEYIRYSFLK